MIERMDKNNSQMNPYVVPAAIVAAGLLIAAAVIYTGGAPRSANQPNQAESEGVVSPVEAAEAVGLNKREFEQCLDSGKYADVVSGDLNEAVATGFGGTPTSVIVSSSGEQYFVEGAVSADMLSTYIDAALAGDDTTLAELEAQAGVGGAAAGDLPDVSAVDADDHVRGDVNAPVKLIEYSDLECPYCRLFHPEVMSVMAQYGSDVAWVYRHLPLESIHPLARPLAEGSECAAELGGNDKFWEYVDYIFSS